MRHTTRVMPIIPAGRQTAAYADADVLFDWHKIEGIKGSTITGIQTIIRGTDGADQAAGTTVGMDLFFASSQIQTPNDIYTNNEEGAKGPNINIDVVPPGLGASNSAVSGVGWYNNLVAYVPIRAADMSDVDLINLNMASNSGLSIPIGRNDLYVAGVSKGVYDFTSTVTCTGVQATSQSGLIVGTTSALLTCAPGDVLHDEDDRLIGTVKSVTDANNMVMTTNLVNATVNAKDLYNISPIQFLITSED